MGAMVYLGVIELILSTGVESLEPPPYSFNFSNTIIQQIRNIWAQCVCVCVPSKTQTNASKLFIIGHIFSRILIISRNNTCHRPPALQLSKALSHFNPVCFLFQTRRFFFYYFGSLRLSRGFHLIYSQFFDICP